MRDRLEEEERGKRGKRGEKGEGRRRGIGKMRRDWRGEEGKERGKER